MADGSYNILVGIEPDVTGLQQKLNAKTQNIKIKTSINMGQKDIDSYVKQWNNQISRMQFKSPDIFKNEEVQANLKVLQETMLNFSQRGGASVQDVRGAFDDLNTSIAKTGASFKNTAKDGYSFSTMLDVAIKKVAVWMIATQVVYGSLRKIEEGVQFIKDLNIELTNAQVVTGMTNEEIEKLGIGYNKLAKEMGATTVEVAQGSLEYLRQGKTIQETSELMKSTLMLSKLGNMEAAEATEKLTSTLNGFKLEAEDASLVVDKIIDLDNRMATSANELSTALQYSAASAQQAGVSFEELLSYVATISSVSRRSAESIGQSFDKLEALRYN